MKSRQRKNFYPKNFQSHYRSILMLDLAKTFNQATMAPKRSLEDDAPSKSSAPNKRRSGFKVGPDNLPDGQWRRKGTHPHSLEQKFHID